MRKLQLFTKEKFRLLLALIFCLVVSTPQLMADDFYILSDVTTWNTGSLLNDNYKMTESNGEWTWSFTATADRDVYFRILGRWSGGWYDNGIAPSSNGTAVTTSYQNCAWNNNNAWKLTVTTGNTYTLYKNSNNQVKYSVVQPTPPTSHYYVTGDNGLGLGGFTYQPTLEMTDPDEDGIYTYTTTATTDGTYNFVFANGQGSSWNNFNSTYRIGPTSGNTEVALNTYHNTQMSGGDNGAYQVSVAAGTVTFYFDPAAMKFKVEGTVPVVSNDYYVKGDNTTIFPNGWNEGASTLMTDNGDGTYTWTSGQFHLDLGTTYEYKVWGSDGSWHPSGANASFSDNVPGTYTVTITYDDNNDVVSHTLNLVQSDPTYNYTFYVLPSDGSTTPYLYLWAVSNTSYRPNGDFAGAAMGTTEQLADGNNWYKYTGAFYYNNMDAIVSNNGNGQTADITNLAPDTYYIRWNVNDNTYTIDTQAPVPAPTYDYTIYVRYKGNATPYMYMWDNNGNLLGAFPGTALTDANTFTTEVINGYTYYKYVVTGSSFASLSMILDEGSSAAQTQNLGVAPGVSYFTYSGGSTSYGPNPQADPATTYYAESDFAGWTSTGTQMSSNGDGSYSKTFTGVSLTGGTNYGYQVYGDDGTNEGVWFGAPQGGNATLRPDMGGTYDVTITLNSDGSISHTLTMTAAGTVYIDGDDILGGFTDQPTLAMTYTSNGIYTYTATLAQPSTINFVFADGQGSDWSNFNNNYRIGPDNGNETYAINSGYTATQKAGGDNGSYNVYAGAGTITFYFDAINMQYKVEGTVPPVTYYVVGQDTNIFPNGWDMGSGTQMTYDSNEDSYSWTSGQVQLTAGTNYEYKVRGNDGSWYPGEGQDNASFSPVVNGTYTVTITRNSDGTVSHTLTLISAAAVYIDGDGILGGFTEQPSLAMTYTSDGIYTYSATLAQPATINFVFANGQGSDWNDFNGNYRIGPANGNETYAINSGYTATQMAGGDNGSYSVYAGAGTITFYLDVVNMQYKVEGAMPPVTYYVVGQDTNIFPNGWNTGSDTEMTYDSTNDSYSWTSGQVELVAGTNYEYKVHGDDGTWYPADGNATFNVTTPGTYTVEFTLDNQGNVTAVPTLISVAKMYIIGNAGSQQWGANAGIEMEWDETNGYYKLENVVLTANSQFAFATTLGSNSDDWTTVNSHRLSSLGNSNYLINEPLLNTWLDYVNYSAEDHNWYVDHAGAYDIYVNPNTHKIMVSEPHGNMYISYGVNWSYENNSLQMSTVDGNIYQATITLNQGDYFLFSTALDDASAWGATEDAYEINDLRIGFAQRIVPGNTENYKFTGTPGKYIVVVNKEKKTVTLRKTTDVTVTKVFLQKTSNVTLNPVGGTYNGQPVEGKRGGIYAWNKLNLEEAGSTYQMTPDHGPTNYTYDGEVPDYGGNGYLKDLSDTTTVDGKEWYAWSIGNSICEFYFIRNNKTDYKSQKIMRRAGEVWLIWVDEDADTDRQDDAQHNDRLEDVSAQYYEVTASGVSDCSTMLEDHYYVYYTNTTGWDSVYCYAWSSDPFVEYNGVYPGKKCTFVGYDEDGYEVWCYDFGLMEDFHRTYGTNDDGEYIIPEHVIFDNGMNDDNTREQTGDMVFDNGACYDYLGMVYLGNSLNGIINTGIVNGPKYTVEDNLIGVYYDENAITTIMETDMAGHPILDENGQPKHVDVRGALYAKDFENYSAKSVQPDGTVDYVYKVCAHKKTTDYPGGSQIQIKRDHYDQSNWVKIVLSPNFDNNHLQNTDVTYNKDLFDHDDFESATANERPYLQQYVGKIIPGGSMSGNLANKVNPQMHITNIAMPVAATEYEKNVYVTSHFNDSVVFSYVHQEWSPGIYDGVYRTLPVLATNDQGETFVDHMRIDDEPTKMFYVAPKPQEVAYITWAVFTHPDTQSGIGTSSCQTEPSSPGEFHAPMNWDRTGQLWNGSNPADDTNGGVPYGTTYGPYSNGYMQYAAFQVNWSLFEGMEIPLSNTNRPQKPWYQIFKPGQAYKILAVIRYAHGDKLSDVEYTAGVYGDGEYNEGAGDHVANAPRRSNDRWEDMDTTPYKKLNESKFIVFPLLGSSEDSDGDDIGNVTAVREVKYVPTSKDIVNVRYYNLMGVGSDQPFDGLNIVVTTYSDGSRTSKKILR